MAQTFRPLGLLHLRLFVACLGWFKPAQYLSPSPSGSHLDHGCQFMGVLGASWMPSEHEDPASAKQQCHLGLGRKYWQIMVYPLVILLLQLFIQRYHISEHCFISCSLF